MKDAPPWLKQGSLSTFCGANDDLPEEAQFGHAIVETDQLLRRLRALLEAKGVHFVEGRVDRLVPPPNPQTDQWQVRYQPLPQGPSTLLGADAVVVAAGSHVLAPPQGAQGTLTHFLADRLLHALPEQPRQPQASKLTCGGEPMVYLCYRIGGPELEERDLPLEADAVSLPSLYLFEGTNPEALEFYFRPDRTLYAHFLPEPKYREQLRFGAPNLQATLQKVAEDFWTDVLAKHLPPELVGAVYERNRLVMSGLCEYPTLFHDRQRLLPVIGPLPVTKLAPCDGLLVVAGLSHRGVQLSVGAACLVATQLLHWLRTRTEPPATDVVLKARQAHWAAQAHKAYPKGPSRRTGASKAYGKDDLPPAYHALLTHAHLLVRPFSPLPLPLIPPERGARQAQGSG